MGDKSLLVVISSPPYTIHAVDGLLTVLGVSPKLGWEIQIFLVGEGVYLAKKGQDALGGIYVRTASSHGVPYHEVNFEKAVERLLKEGVKVFTCRDTCKGFSLDPSELVDGVTMADYCKLAEESMRTKATFYF